MNRILDAGRLSTRSRRDRGVHDHDAAPGAVRVRKFLRGGMIAAVVAALLGSVLAVTPAQAEPSSTPGNGGVDFVAAAVATPSRVNLALLTDGDTSSNSYSGDLNDDVSRSFTLDFGAEKGVAATSIGLQARSGWGSRIVGGTVSGSFDGTTWTEITSSRAVNSPDLQTLPVGAAYTAVPYRYLKIGGDGDGTFSISELRISGQLVALPQIIDSVTIRSTGASTATAVEGDKIVVSAHATVALGQSTLSIGGVSSPLTATADDAQTYTASYTVTGYEKTGPVPFVIVPRTADGTYGRSIVAPTDGSPVEIQEGSDFIAVGALASPRFAVRNSAGVDVISTDAAVSASAAQNGAALTDGNPLTWGEFQYPASAGSDASIIFDLGEGARASLSRVYVLARVSIPDRVRGLVIDGSIDGSTWKTLTAPGVGQIAWQRLAVKDSATYRYLRVHNTDFWYGNVAEVKFYGRYVAAGAADTVALASAITQGAALQRGNYTDSTWDALQNALSAGRVVIADPQSTAAAVDAAVTAITTAIAGLAEPLPTFVGASTSGLQHPGVSISADQLSSIRTHVQNGDEPWATYYATFAKSRYSSKDYVIENDAAPGSATLKPKYGYADFNTGFMYNQMTNDANAAYYQALMYYFTGDKSYREKSIRILRLWSLLDPSAVSVFYDGHIQQGPPMLTMNSAAELIRHTSTFDDSLVWTQADTDKYYANYIKPALDNYMYRNDYYFNQHQTAVMATISSFIFMDDKAKYDQLVEWYTVNSTAPASDAFSNGSLMNAFFETATNYDGTTLDKPIIVVKEMGRDQPHASGDVGSLAAIARVLKAQGTLLDPTAGTPSKAADAVNVYQFGGDRLLKGANYWSAYNLGYSVPFNDGTGAKLNDQGRGRYTNYADLYYYYRYVAGYSDSDPDMKYLAEQVSRNPAPTDDTWLSVPDQAANSPLPSAPFEYTGGTGPFQVEINSTTFGPEAVKQSEGDTTFLRVTPSQSGAQFAILNQFNWHNGTIALRIRTTAVTTLELSRDSGVAPFKTITLPDTGGAWKFANFTIADIPASQFPDDIQIMFLKVIGSSSSKVDFDSVYVNSSAITPPVFAGGKTGDTVNTYVGGTISAALPATDSDKSQTVAYSLVNAPNGARIDQTGTVTWTPSASGTYPFLVQASDGTTITLLTLTVEVTGDYDAAIAKVIAPYDATALYVKATVSTFTDALAKAKSASGDGRDAALAELAAAVAGLRLLTPHLADGTFDYRGLTTSSISEATIQNLTDGDPVTSTQDLWIEDDHSFVMDFGAGFHVSASEFRIQPRANFPGRSAGMIVYGSDDKQSWVPLTDPSISSDSVQSIPVHADQQKTAFRYLRFKDVDGGVGNTEQRVEDQPFSLGELRIVGTRTEAVSRLSSVSMKSGGASPIRAEVGDTVTLTFVATEDIKDVAVTFGGQPVSISHDGSTWRAVSVVAAGVSSGQLPFRIDYTTADGMRAAPASSTTDSTSVFVSDTSNLIAQVQSKTTVTTSANTAPDSTIAKLFDGNPATYSEFVDSSGSGAEYITFDFGKNDGSKVKITRVEWLARTYFSSRLSGAVAQGSNDNVNWVNLTKGATATEAWQSAGVDQAQSVRAFRYIRLTNGGGWLANIGDVRFFGEYGTGLSDGALPTYTVAATADPAGGGVITMGLGATATDQVASLTNVAYGALVTLKATPARGYAFVNWTQKKVVEGKTVDYAASNFPIFNPGWYTGGYLGGTRYTQVIENWDLTAHFVKVKTPPLPPSDVTATAGDASAIVSWKAPIDDGGSPITGYTVTASPGGGTCIATSATTCTVRGLTNGTSYSFAVTAKTADGTSDPSTSSSVVTPASATKTTLAASAATQTYGTQRPLTLTATVRGTGSVVPQGQVRFVAGGVTLGVVPVTAAGKALLALPSLTGVGLLQVEATFEPSAGASSSSSTSSAVRVRVLAAKSTTGLSASSLIQLYAQGKPVKLTARVALETGRAASGSVVFSSGGTLATVPVVNGAASFTLPGDWAIGPHRIKATFVPSDSTASGSSSTQLIVLVLPSRAR